MSIGVKILIFRFSVTIEPRQFWRSVHCHELLVLNNHSSCHIYMFFSDNQLDFYWFSSINVQRSCKIWMVFVFYIGMATRIDYWKCCFQRSKRLLENMERSFKRLFFMVMGKFQGFKKNSMEQYQEKLKNSNPLISVLLIAIWIANFFDLFL